MKIRNCACFYKYHFRSKMCNLTWNQIKSMKTSDQRINKNTDSASRKGFLCNLNVAVNCFKPHLLYPSYNFHLLDPFPFFCFFFCCDIDNIFDLVFIMINNMSAYYIVCSVFRQYTINQEQIVCPKILFLKEKYFIIIFL